MQLRRLSANTLEPCNRNQSVFGHCGKPIEELSEINVRQFFGHLQLKDGCAQANCYSAAIQFFFVAALNRTMNCLQIPRMKAL
ncbi:MAG: hypothetical protein FWG10_03395 [Eubacteriaceae bacterium]|nr:hypothetical protein [Eubacteriaceae bacterium]